MKSAEHVDDFVWLALLDAYMESCQQNLRSGNHTTRVVAERLSPGIAPVVLDAPQMEFCVALGRGSTLTTVSHRDRIRWTTRLLWSPFHLTAGTIEGQATLIFNDISGAARATRPASLSVFRRFEGARGRLMINGRHLISYSDYTICIHSLSEPESASLVDVESRIVACCSLGENHFAVALESGEIRLGEKTTGLKEQRYMVSDRPMLLAPVGGASLKIIAGGVKGSLQLIDLSDKSATTIVLGGGSGAITCLKVQLTSDDAIIVSATEDGLLSVCSLRNSTLLWTDTLRQGRVNCQTLFSFAGRHYCMTASSEGGMRVYELLSGTLLVTIPTPAPVTSLVAASDEGTPVIYSVDADGLMRRTRFHPKLPPIRKEKHL